MNQAVFSSLMPTSVMRKTLKGYFAGAARERSFDRSADAVSVVGKTGKCGTGDA